MGKDRFEKFGFEPEKEVGLAEGIYVVEVKITLKIVCVCVFIYKMTGEDIERILCKFSILEMCFIKQFKFMP